MSKAWILKWESKHPYYRMEFYFRAEKEHLTYGSDNRKLLGISRNNVMQCYYDEEDQDRIKRNSLGVLLNQKRMLEYFRVTSDISTGLFSLLSEWRDDLDGNGLKEFYGKVIREYQRLYTTYDLSRPEYFEDAERLLKSKMSDEDFHIMTTSTEDTTLTIEKRDFLNIVALQQKDEINKHQEKYGWIGNSEDEHPWSIEFYQKRFSSIKPEQAIVQMEADKEKVGKLREKQKMISSKLDSQTLYLCDVIRKMACVRLESRLDWARADRLLNNIFVSTASRFDVDTNDIFYYNEADIIRLVDGYRLDDSTINKRKEAFAFKYSEDSFGEYNGEDEVTSLEIEECVVHKDLDVSLIKGTVANKGLARGRVKIINAHTLDQHKAGEDMNRGDILVTGMTRPHLIYAIEKAAAIITDEGGITSHAAIISREFGIPCIIGTKIATKVLKDGDTVEVDAEKGVVRVIKTE